MNILDSVVDFPNNQSGEDCMFQTHKCAGIIDGSTPVQAIEFKSYRSQASWLAQSLKNEILDNDKGSSIVESCYKTISRFWNDEDIQNLKEENRPCAVLAGVEEEQNELILTVIGDCTIAIQYTDFKIDYFTDNRIKVFSKKTADAKRKAISSGDNVHFAIKQQMKQNRQLMNTENGFWTIAFKSDFRNGVLKYKIPISKILKVLVYSDGFERLFKISDIKIEEIMNQNIPLSECISILRDIELKISENDSNEIKKQDDASAILLNFFKER